MLPPQELIRKKRDSHSLSRDEMNYFFGGYLRDEVPDYQVSAMLMAITLNGMSFEEAVALTEIARDSGTCLSWDFPRERIVDKHSTGGIGDKTSLILLPLAVLEGLKVPMISGRGLGHTGGTLDKLEAIPGMNVRPTLEQARTVLHQHGGVFMGQTQEIAALDQRLYALRDVTATVESIPLITASILSKKLAEGLGGLVMDVKFGSGAFMRELADARELARHLFEIGQRCGVNVRVLLTSMDSALGSCAGNALEVTESIAVLQGEGPEDTTELSVALAAEMVRQAYPERPMDTIKKTLRDHLHSGKAFEKFCDIIEAQGGDRRALEDPSRMPKARFSKEVLIQTSGFIESIDVRALGLAVLALGGGRRKVSDQILPGVGLSGLRRVGSQVRPGETLLTIHGDSQESIDEAAKICEGAFHFGAESKADTLILEVMS